MAVKSPFIPKEYGVQSCSSASSACLAGVKSDHLWSFEDPPEEDTIKSHIKGLRQKLKAAGAPTDLIETVLFTVFQALYLTGKVPNTGIRVRKLGARANYVAVAKAREDFKAGISERLAVLEQATNALRESKLEINCWSTAEQEAHKLAGSLKFALLKAHGSPKR